MNNTLQLTHKQLEMHAYILSTAATDGLVLMHQAISIHCADYIYIYILCNGPVSYKNITFMVNNIWK